MILSKKIDVQTSKIRHLRKKPAWKLVFCLISTYLCFNKRIKQDSKVKQKNIAAMSTTEFHSRFDQMTTILHSFAYNLTKNGEDAKDLFQETAYRALTNRDKFRPGTNFKAWLFTIMKNIFINNYRKKVKANTIMDSTDNLYYINSGSVVISNQAESSIMMKELTKMIEGLDDSIKIPFLMHYQGYKYQEIADHLELPLGTVKSRIFFARKELKSLIGKRYGSLVNTGESADA
jgi:RNA polymerase sigma-70 factor, ECF subfamily